MIKKARTRLKLLRQVTESQAPEKDLQDWNKRTISQRQEQENKKLLTCTMNNSDSVSLVQGPPTATCMMWAEQKQGKEKRDLLMHTD
jgi:hypothetical protein